MPAVIVLFILIHPCICDLHCMTDVINSGKESCSECKAHIFGFGFEPAEFIYLLLKQFFCDFRTEYDKFISSGTVDFIAVGGRLLPAHDEYFTANMILRIIGILMMFVSVNMITYFGGKFLVEELEKYVCYDTLTHLLNRRSMDDYLQKAYQEANADGTDFCLMMLDIDDFKKVNDTYGHDCGDEVLRCVANTISTGVRKNDTVFRWGGEEILVLMQTAEQQASDSAERIRHEIEKDTIRYRGENLVSVTVTIGISAYRNGMTIQQMMDEADKKLYYGKNHGKNQVVSCLPQATLEG